MKRLAFGIALAFLPACVVGSPVAEEQQSANEQLRADIGPLCDKGCAKNTECGFNGLDDECPTHCRDYLSAFVDHGDECVALGRSIVDCASKLETCADYEDTSECDVPPEEQSRCAAGSSGSPPVYCDTGGGTSGGMAPSSNGDPATTTSCDLYMQSCSDGAEYRVSCHAVDETLVCNCFRDGIVNGSAFTPASGECPADGEINAPCGWNLQN